MTAANEANGWYGGTLLGDQDESSEIYRHYAELIQVTDMSTPFILSVSMLCFFLTFAGLSHERFNFFLKMN